MTNKKLSICYSRRLPCAQVWDVKDKFEKIYGQNKSFFEKSRNLAVIVKKKKVGLEIGPNFVCKCPFEMLPYAYETASKVRNAIFGASRDV